MADIWRIDPEDCGCTDCIIGESKPINICTKEELLAAALGYLDNASGHELRAETRIKYDG